MVIELEAAYIVAGFSSIIGITIATILGVKIILKYFQFKRRIFIFVGLTAILICEPWWPSAFGFLTIMLTGQNLTVETYLILGVVLLPILALCWLIAFTDLLYHDRQKLILTIFAVYGIIFEIIFFSLLFTNSALIGDLSGYFDPNYGLFVRSYQYSLMSFLGITFILFARESLKSENPEVKLKGKLILAAIITFVTGSSIEIFSLPGFPNVISVVFVIIARSIMILTAIEFYGALVLPEWMKKILLKSK